MKVTKSKVAQEKILEVAKEKKVFQRRDVSNYYSLASSTVSSGQWPKAFDSLVRRGLLRNQGRKFYYVEPVKDAQPTAEESLPTTERQLFDNLLATIQAIVDYRCKGVNDRITELEKENSKIKSEVENRFIGKLFNG